jgi:hypothetical protein
MKGKCSFYVLFSQRLALKLAKSAKNLKNIFERYQKEYQKTQICKPTTSMIMGKN